MAAQPGGADKLRTTAHPRQRDNGQGGLVEWLTAPSLAMPTKAREGSPSTRSCRASWRTGTTGSGPLAGSRVPPVQLAWQQQGQRQVHRLSALGYPYDTQWPFDAARVIEEGNHGLHRHNVGRELRILYQFGAADLGEKQVSDA
jgi:hypothetical protein